MAEAWRPKRTRIERLDRSIRSQSPGISSGRIASAMPVRITPGTGMTEEEDQEDSGSDAARFWQDEFVVSKVGDQTFMLTWLPVTNSEHVYWEGWYQSSSHWLRSGKVFMIKDPDELLQIGDRITMEYAYSPLTVAENFMAPYIGANGAEGQITSLALPGGVLKDDLLVVAIAGRHPVTVSDPRLTGSWVFGSTAQVWWGHATEDMSPLDISHANLGGVLGSDSHTSVVAYRNVVVTGADGKNIGGYGQSAPIIDQSGVAVIAAISFSGTVAGGVSSNMGAAWTGRYANRADKKGTGHAYWDSDDGTRKPTPASALTMSGTYGTIYAVTLRLEVI